MKKNNSSILVDKNIIELVSTDNLISPFDPNLLSGCSYDIRVGSLITSRNRTAQFDLDKEPYVIESGECVTITSLEEFSFRNKSFFGIIVNKHSILGQGLFHPITTVDPGFVGQLAITFIHLGHVPYTIKKGDKICNIVFQSLSESPDRVYGVTQRPTVKEGSTDYSLVIKEPDESLRNKSLKFTYGTPFTDLLEKVQELEKRIEKLDSSGELIYYKKEEEKRKDKAIRNRWLIGLVFTILGLILGYVFFGGLKLASNNDTTTTKPTINTIKDSIRESNSIDTLLLSPNTDTSRRH